MIKFILHGGATRRDSELNRTFFEELVRNVPDGGQVLLVFFASKQEDNTDSFNELKEKTENAAPEKQLRVIMATQENFLDELKDSDAVYMHGGSTTKLLGVLREFPPLEPLMEGKTIAGSSAGAYAIAAYGASHSEDAMREGLALAPLRVVCHYESPDLPPMPTALAAVEGSHQELELVYLHDCEWKVFNF